ncbi:hypothetical protein QBC46DRAFT_19724 [Diplogelasinospora grovesii]|uniref:LYR motif-containing protein Cup1-like N-terminal domain-containing protein n=1 Tax=Diplogelasinospora grovesii TaxID=303347 RepID=A0AAN6S1G7_9PEZI|nr:hypothetical protein QBC46DRAFT_19724 [Diplogelasinospora grovesii]
MSPLQIPHPKTTLHLYRHLLREASYLPPAARPFITGRIQARFRSHRFEGQPKAYIRQGHHGLRCLRAANAGDVIRMRRVLFLAFGRLGRRRRELVDELVRRPPPVDSAALEKAIESTVSSVSGRDPDWLDKWDLDKLSAFVQSQTRTSHQTTPKSAITSKQADPAKSVPAEDIWGRALSPRLARSKLRKGWKILISKVLPPLPKSEWQLLYNLAQGNVPRSEWDVPARRSVALSEPANHGIGSDDQAWDWKAYATKPVSRVDIQRSRRNMLLSGAVDEASLVKQQPLVCHHYTPRLWRRLYGNILQISATMDKKSNGEGWDVVWGKQEFKAPPATARHMEFFEGIPGSSKSQDPPPSRKRKTPSPASAR